MANKGYIKLYREIADNPLWESPEPFDIRSAWIDLIIMVNHKDAKVIIGKQEITVKRGQRFTSIRKLAEQWHWSPKRTLEYIRLLERMGMVYRTKMCNGTLLTVVNYGFYQGQGNTFDNTFDNTCVSTDDNTTVSQTIMNKNDIKNDIKMKNNKPSAFEDF